MPATALLRPRCHRPTVFCRIVQVRYRYRIYPTPAQRQSLARVFGCARVVYNDCLRLRDQCQAAGEKISDTEVQHQVITLAKRFEPTSQVCSACGVKDGPKALSVRVWQCTSCGAILDRDFNAAKNILAAGRADRLNACGGDVRPGPALAVAAEAGTHRSAA
jgi:transposase